MPWSRNEDLTTGLRLAVEVLRGLSRTAATMATPAAVTRRVETFIAGSLQRLIDGAIDAAPWR